MARKANIIKCLKMMGYSVRDYGGTYWVSLLTDKGMVIERFYSYEELEYGNFIVEKVVGDMNRMIVENS